MTLQETLGQLKKYGTAQNIKIYKRHGAGDNLFGVSFANLTVLRKKIKVDHELAQELWETGNTDARTLAIMIADPESLTAPLVDRWMKDIEKLGYYLLGDLLSGLVAKSTLADSRMKKWMKSKQEFQRQVGYDILACRLRNDDESISVSECKTALRVIKKEIHNSANRARHAMNMTLIAIGVYVPELRISALEVADEIGRVEVDHGETSCKTPAARPYIERATLRPAKKTAKKKRSAKKRPQRSSE